MTATSSHDLFEDRVTIPVLGKDASSGYVPDIPAPPPVFRCSGHRCRRRRTAQYEVAATSRNALGSQSGSAIHAGPPPPSHQKGGGPSSSSVRHTADSRGWRRAMHSARRYYEETVLRKSATDERESFSVLSGGRYMCVRLDKRCWLEVEDEKHRYAKNLRRYHYEWAVRLSKPEISFWSWLTNHESLSLASCARDRLDNEVVRYCRVDQDRQKYALCCVDQRLMSQLCTSDVLEDEHQRTLMKSTSTSPPGATHNRSASNGQVREAAANEAGHHPNGLHHTTHHHHHHHHHQSGTLAAALPPQNVGVSGARWGRLNTGSKGWIFVLQDGVLYARFKGTHAGRERFHHSSFFGGECVDAAGVIVAKDGVVTRLLPHSGHYRPREAHFARLLLFLKDRLRIDLDRVEVDVQRLMRQARPEHSKKVDTPLYWRASDAFNFLFVKAMAKASNLLRDIEAFRLSDDELDAIEQERRAGVSADDDRGTCKSPIPPYHANGWNGGGAGQLRRTPQQRASSLRRSSGTALSRASLKAECQRDQQQLEERMLAANLGVGATSLGRADALAADAAALAAAGASTTATKTTISIPSLERDASDLFMPRQSTLPEFDGRELEASNPDFSESGDEDYAERRTSNVIFEDIPQSPRAAIQVNKGIPIERQRSADEPPSQMEPAPRTPPTSRPTSPTRRSLTSPRRHNRASSLDPHYSISWAANIPSGQDDSALSFSWGGPSRSPPMIRSNARRRRSKRLVDSSLDGTAGALIDRDGGLDRSYSSLPLSGEWWSSADTYSDDARNDDDGRSSNSTDDDDDDNRSRTELSEVDFGGDSTGSPAAEDLDQRFSGTFLSFPNKNSDSSLSTNEGDTSLTAGNTKGKRQKRHRRKHRPSENDGDSKLDRDNSSKNDDSGNGGPHTSDFDDCDETNFAMDMPTSTTRRTS